MEERDRLNARPLEFENLLCERSQVDVTYRATGESSELQVNELARGDAQGPMR
jgi:hypothetical protein